jgi:protein-S-isoprenylcysteine O-methyltransferase Ste14
MAGEDIPRSILLLGHLGLTFLFLSLCAAGAGGWAAFLSSPARATFAAATLLLAAGWMLSPFNVSTGRREDARNRWVMLPGVAFPAVAAWLFARLDVRDRWVVDGDTIRWLGVAIYLVGGALRLWPIFVLGRRFSGLVAIQEGHTLVTDGPYRWIRNPSYLGGLVGVVGWALVFRSAVGLLLAVVLLWPTVARIDAEEALLASEFGAEYDAYRRRTWRLVPGMY